MLSESAGYIIPVSLANIKCEVTLALISAYLQPLSGPLRQGHLEVDFRIRHKTKKPAWNFICVITDINLEVS